MRTIRPDGRGKRKLPCTRQVVEYGCTDYVPAFSPDGRRLAIGTWNVVAMLRANGERLPDHELPDHAYVEELAWSPTGRRLALAEFNRIAVLDLRDGSYRTLLRVPAETVTWSRQRRLAWTGANTGHIVITDKRHRVVRRIRAGAGRVQWSPDGRRLLYEKGEHVYTIRPDGSDRRRLRVRCETLDSNAVWSPDGRSIACAFGNQIVITNWRTGKQRWISVGNALVQRIDWQARPRGRGRGGASPARAGPS